MRLAILSLISVGLLIVPGCSNATNALPVAVVPAEGTLTYRGQPVVEAQLILRSDHLSEPAFAVTDANGRFQCLTNDSGDGIPPGEYVVTVSSRRGRIPAKYATVETSPLFITVEEGTVNRFPLDLED